jgi:hypothetical protein
MAFYTGMQECINSRKKYGLRCYSKKAEFKSTEFSCSGNFAAYVESCGKIKEY